MLRDTQLREQLYCNYELVIVGATINETIIIDCVFPFIQFNQEQIKQRVS